jgi:hypothetical protein
LPHDEYGALIALDFVHHEIHEGDHFSACVYDADVDIASPKYVRLTAPDSLVRCHLIWDVSANGEFLIQFYEDPTLNAAGAAVVRHNNDRNSTNTAAVTVFQDTTTQAPNNDGTLLCSAYSGGEKKKSNAEAGSRQEWILEQDQDYILKLTVAADNTEVNFNLAWYEHTV